MQSRPGAMPATANNSRPIVIVTMQKLLLSGSDVFYEINDLRTDDGGATWSGPSPHPDALGRRLLEGGVEEGVSDFWPSWHAKTGTLLGTGHTVRYVGDHLQPFPRRRSTAYSVYDPAARAWSAWNVLDLPDDPRFFNEGAGSTQRLDLPNGEVLLPIYYARMDTARGTFHAQMVSTVMRCAFDGRTLRYIEHGTELTLPTGRGFAEPSLARAGDRFYLTLRNNDAGWVAAGDDGLHYDSPRPWTFDDGAELGSYNTQQHWITHGHDLYLVYTRRGADNDHVLRHRAPLFIAQVDTDSLCVIRSTERVLVPDRGAALGNFGVTQVSDHEWWVVTSEWMQAPPPDPYDCRICEQRGSDNSVFVASVTWP